MDKIQNRKEFIKEHLLHSAAKKSKTYDLAKARNTYHSLDYSKRKCAKALWRKSQKRRNKSFPQLSIDKVPPTDTLILVEEGTFFLN